MFTVFLNLLSYSLRMDARVLVEGNLFEVEVELFFFPMCLKLLCFPNSDILIGFLVLLPHLPTYRMSCKPYQARHLSLLWMLPHWSSYTHRFNRHELHLLNLHLLITYDETTFTSTYRFRWTFPHCLQSLLSIFLDCIHHTSPCF